MLRVVQSLTIAHDHSQPYISAWSYELTGTTPQQKQLRHTDTKYDWLHVCVDC